MSLRVSGNQERYLLAERFTEASYPIPFSYRIAGTLDARRLEEAINTVVDRHAILRMRFQSERNGFVADRNPATHIWMEQVQLSGADNKAVRAFVADRFDRKLKAFVPAELTRALLVSTADDAHVLTLSMHHAISDGVSMDIFAREVFACYRGETLPEPPPCYYDVLAAQAVSETQILADSAFWTDALADTGDVASLRADLDNPDAPHGEYVEYLEFAAVSAIATNAGVTPFVVMLALSNIVLGRYAGSDDVLLTVQSSGRKPFPGSSGVIGPFSNSVVLRGTVELGELFTALARRLSAALGEALGHELYPYHLVVRETGVQPSFGINWFPASNRLEVPGLEISDRDFLFYDSNYDLNIRFVRDGAALRLLLHYDARSYSQDRVAQVARAFADGVTALAGDSGLTVSGVLPSPTPLAVPHAAPAPPARIFDAFLAQAAATPERIAVVGDAGEISYGELNRLSAGLARRLAEAGLGVGSRIAIVAERGTTLVWTMLGVLRLGATMVPLDSDYPEERLRTLVGVARPDALLLLRPGETPAWAASIEMVLCATGAIPADLDIDDPRLAAGDPDAPAYMLFTSGSTGTPKCIATSHRPVLNFLAWQRETFGLDRTDCFTNLCGLAHDMMIRDVFAPLSIGARLAIPRQETIFKPGSLLDWCSAQRPTVTHLTPAMGKLLAMAPGAKTLPLRLMFFGGDRLTAELVSAMQQLAPDAEIVNFYGATETPQAAGFHRCDPAAAWRTFPIGHGIDNFDLRIVDAAHQPVADGAPGEIAVLSPFLSLGYVREGRIVPHPEPGIYYTGDTGFLLPSGEVMFTGRTDDQINIRGYRIELEEVSGTLASHPSVGEAQILIEGGDANPRLIGFATGKGLDADELYAWMSRKLPHYMVPAEIVCIDRLPLLPNGKLDRKALLATPRTVRGRTDLRGAQSEIEAELVNAWQQHIGAPVSPEQSFAELRGDSLTYVQVFLATETIVGPLPDDWQTMKLADIALLDDGKPTGWYKLVDGAMVVRAVAIILVVALHLKLFSAGGGATSALLMVSGYLIGKLQLSEVERTQSSAPLWRLTGRVLLPAALYTTLFFLVKTVMGKPVSLSIPLLYADFIDYRDHAAMVNNGEAFFLWYICAFLHIMLAVSALAWAMLSFAPRHFQARTFIIWLFVAALPLKFLLPALFDPTVLAHGVPLGSVYGYLPTSHMSTLLLGACLAGVQSQRNRLIWFAVTLAYATATYFFVPSNSFIILIAVAAMLLFVRRLPIPSGLHIFVLYLSGASLFIYLTHLQAAQLFGWVGVPPGNWFLLPGVLAIGIGIWLVWQKLTPFARRLSPL